MKSLILNEIYSASLFHHLFLSCYIFKYIVIIDVEWDGYGESPSDGPRPRFYLCGDGDGNEDGFKGGDGDGKAIPASPCPVAIPIGASFDNQSCHSRQERVILE